MKLKTSLQLSAVFPIVFASVIALSLRVWTQTHPDMETVDFALLAMMGILGLSMAGIILFYSRDILSKVAILNQWIDGVLAGNLDQTIDVGTADDEVSKLSRALGRMLAELKTAYTGVQQESLRHRKNAEKKDKGMQASQLATRHLMSALEKLKQNHIEDLHQERTKVLEMAVRGAAHDFSEAIMPISASCEMLDSDPGLLADPARVKETLAIIQNSAVYCRRLARDLAGYAHAGEEDGGPTDGLSTIDQAVALAKPLCDAHKPHAQASIDIRVQADVIPPLAVGEADLREALFHLLRNAIEAMPNGGPVFISARLHKSSVTLEVRDTGEGMTPEIYKRCTEPYYSTREGTGKGRGLTVVNSMTRRYGGQMLIDSTSNAGTRVVLTLPTFNTAPQKKDPPAAAPARTTPTTPTAHRILFVDDEPIIRQVMDTILHAKGHQVMVAADGATALTAMQNGEFDAAIIDRSMPGMSGDELAAIIRQNHPGLPILMLTGYGDIMLKTKEMPSGVDVVLPKTAPTEALLGALDKALRERPARLGD